MKKKQKNSLDQKQPQPKDFWDSLSPRVKERIEQGLADVDAGRYSPIKPVIERLMSE
ncbi:hypothetical protein [Emticicia sp. C21]|uniref:hypothetical protein n=1 Tax=Emticicia sp. C21 TaxID=2302915 RepID=UPI0013147D23|nr:hypothetical protein [Emticicia sp. C21]